jgi:NTE family protein
MKFPMVPGGTSLPIAAVLLAISSLVFATTGNAQEHPGSLRRPKVGLVLSGGGALGVAHVGVLKALEELHIPIDYIAGTSMGAVVGGLYASGMSPAELDEWFRHADWHFLLADSLPRESESFRNKQRQFDMNQAIAFNVKGKELKLPAGLVAGRNVTASLRQLTVPVRYVHDFDRLPIPFRAIATDFETGDLVALFFGQNSALAELIYYRKFAELTPGVGRGVYGGGRSKRARSGRIRTISTWIMRSSAAAFFSARTP